MKSVIDQAGNLSKRIALRLAREGTRRLPLSSHVLGPPRGVLPSTEEWCRQNADAGADYLLLAPDQQTSIAAPLLLEEPPKKYLNQLNAPTPCRFVATIPQGRVCHSGLVLTPDDYVLGDVTYSTSLSAFDDGNLPILERWKLPPMQQHEGTVGVIASLWADNYYHWLFDVVPRLHLLQQSGWEIENFAAPCHTAFQKQTLELLGISPNRWIDDADDLHVEADGLVVPSLPGNQGNPPRWISEFLYESLTVAARNMHPEYSSSKYSGKRPKRIYISREGGKRCVTNEEQILEILEPLGFQSMTMEGLSVAEQVLLFNNADAVIGPHGAALANLVFCRPQTRVIEFLAPGWVYPVYNFIGAHGDLRLACLIGEGQRPLPKNHERYRDENITVNLDQLKIVLKELEL